MVQTYFVDEVHDTRARVYVSLHDSSTLYRRQTLVGKRKLHTDTQTHNAVHLLSTHSV